MELGTVLAKSQVAAPPRGGRVMAEAEGRGWVIPFAPGQYLYTAPWAALFRLFQERLVAQAVQALGFEEWVFPRLIPTAALDSFELTQYAPEMLLTVRDTPDRILDPVQCVAVYHFLRGQSLDPTRLPLKIVEALGGWTWRNETPARLDGPYRAKEFARVEHVYVGTPEQVRDTRRRVAAALTGFVTELGMSWQLVVGAGCMDIPSVIAARSTAQGPDDIPVQDIEVPIRGALALPPPTVERVSGRHDEYDGGGLVSEANSPFYLDTDELCGCSVEGDHLVASFGITAAGGPLWSGCCGIGLNRLIVGFLYQHGFDPVAWPGWVRDLWSAAHRD